MIDSGLFVGTLRHRRFTPVRHAFTYPLFMALLDVDRVAELMRVLAKTIPNGRSSTSRGLTCTVARMQRRHGSPRHERHTAGAHPVRLILQGHG